MLKGIPDPSINAAVFNILRTLKKLNKGDTYYENYQGHYRKYGENFYDYYHLLWEVGPKLNPHRMMEIGCRTGISICQLLASLYDYKDRKVVLFDTFADGFISPELVKINLRHLNIPTEIIEFVVGNSLETVPKYKQDHPTEKFDYILVDGDHSTEGSSKDLENAYEMLAPNGILVFDDIAPDGMNLKSVWEAFKEKHKEGFEFNENYNGKGTSWMIKK